MAEAAKSGGPVALITGITGQDGSYLAELLLEKEYKVYGIIRRHAVPYFPNIQHLLDRVVLLDADLADFSSLLSAVKACQPDEIYHLAAQSYVGVSFTQPTYTGDITGLGVTRVLESVRSAWPSARIYNASSSELFGGCLVEPLNEEIAPEPLSPYAVAKLYGHRMAQVYRRAYGMFVVSGILFNHESPRRGPEFVTRKISLGVAKIALGIEHKIRLGNLDAMRDWGYAPEYVDAMWRMLQAEEPEDYVIATGTKHSVREFLEIAFKHVGIQDYSDFIEIDASLLRPSDVPSLRGDASKARIRLGWEPTMEFEGLVRCMVDADLKLVSESEPRIRNLTSDEKHRLSLSASRS
jgi:GDPmannose 4,6-dehydratase